MDCNSIIYDVVYEGSPNGEPLSFDFVIQRVLEKIREYIVRIQPTHLVFIAFDGVAPLAKLEQQRTRRYKSWFQTQWTNMQACFQTQTQTQSFDTAWITPGTPFMNALNEALYSSPLFRDLNVNVILSGSDQLGEGEHKIFDHLLVHTKNTVPNPKNKQKPNTFRPNVVVYGLDADLIMLSLNAFDRLQQRQQIFLFREQKEDQTQTVQELLLNIGALSTKIGVSVPEYILMGFFLGNDFMPHFPALNIRTGGIHKLLDAYKAIGSPLFVDRETNALLWPAIRRWLGHLQNLEESYWITEHRQREKASKHKNHYQNNNKQSTSNAHEFPERLPMQERALEKYINPLKAGWQSRYYETLFPQRQNQNQNQNIDDICLSYCQGIEWNWKYYTEGCVDWQWKYGYHYPPLLSDLFAFVGQVTGCLFSHPQFNPVNEVFQLCYVMPRFRLKDVLPKPFVARLLQEHGEEWYATDCRFVWAYCKFFWEAHVDLPEIDVPELLALCG